MKQYFLQELRHPLLTYFEQGQDTKISLRGKCLVIFFFNAASSNIAWITNSFFRKKMLLIKTLKLCKASKNEYGDALKGHFLQLCAFFRLTQFRAIKIIFLKSDNNLPSSIYIYFNSKGKRVMLMLDWWFLTFLGILKLQWLDIDKQIK